MFANVDLPVSYPRLIRRTSEGCSSASSSTSSLLCEMPSQGAPADQLWKIVQHQLSGSASEYDVEEFEKMSSSSVELDLSSESTPDNTFLESVSDVAAATGCMTLCLKLNASRHNAESAGHLLATLATFACLTSRRAAAAHGVGDTNLLGAELTLIRLGLSKQQVNMVSRAANAAANSLRRLCLLLEHDITDTARTAWQAAQDLSSAPNRAIEGRCVRLLVTAHHGDALLVDPQLVARATNQGLDDLSPNQIFESIDGGHCHLSGLVDSNSSMTSIGLLMACIDLNYSGDHPEQCVNKISNLSI